MRLLGCFFKICENPANDQNSKYVHIGHPECVNCSCLDCSDSSCVMNPLQRSIFDLLCIKFDVKSSMLSVYAQVICLGCIESIACILANICINYKTQL